MSSPQRSLGIFSVIAMVLSLQLGSGTFLLPNQLAPYGIWGVLSWLIAGTGAMALCHVFSALAAAHPMDGGPHLYIDHAFGKRWAFYAGWTYWVLGWIASAPLIILAMDSLGNLVGDLGEVGRFLGPCILLWFTLVLNIRGSKLSGLGELIFAVLKITPLFLLPLLSIPFWKTELLLAPVAAPPLSALNAASLLTFFCFTGLEAGTTVADCVKNPRKTIPRGLFFGTLVVMTIYIINTVGIFSTLSKDIILANPNSYRPLLDHCLGIGWGKIMDATIFIVCVGSLNAWILAGGQVMATGAKHGLFPAVFGTMNRYNSPAIGVKITTGCLLACILFMRNKTINDQIHMIIEFATALYIPIYILSIAALVALIRRGDISKGWLLYGSIGTSLAFCFWLLSSLAPMMLLGCTIIPLSGYVLAWAFSWPVR
jgi:APA family basic amino acid/polyamine antiporter